LLDAKERMGGSVKRSCPFLSRFFSFFKWELNTQRRVALPTKKHSVQQPREEEEEEKSSLSFFFSLSKSRIKKMMKKALRRRIFRFCNNTIRVMPRSSGQNITKHGGGKKFRPIRRRKKK
jgi:hypothetical protein